MSMKMDARLNILHTFGLEKTGVSKQRCQLFKINAVCRFCYDHSSDKYFLGKIHYLIQIFLNIGNPNNTPPYKRIVHSKTKKRSSYSEFFLQSL